MTTDITHSEYKGLVRAVQTLTKEVERLNNRLESEYPKRGEVAIQARKRIYKTLLFSTVLILLAQGLTLSTISYCFLDPSPEPKAKFGCQLVPGYSNAIESNRERLGRFFLLLEQTDTNRDNIADLDTRLQILENRESERR